MSSTIFAFPGSEKLARGVSEALGIALGTLALHRFPDGESLVRIETPVAGQRTALVCTLRDPDTRILPLLFAARQLRDAGAASVGLVAPYLAYMRQDQRFHAGEALTSVEFANLISTRFDWLVTVDPHLHRFARLEELYRIPATALHCGEVLAGYVAGLERPLLVGPDSESEQWVGAVARQIGAPHVVLAKVRHGDRDVRIAIPDMAPYRDRAPVLVDDIISSGHTMLTALRGWPAGGPRPLCLGIHAVFAADAYEELLAARPCGIVTTNSIPHPSNAIDLTGLIAAELRHRLG